LRSQQAIEQHAAHVTVSDKSNLFHMVFL